MIEPAMTQKTSLKTLSYKDKEIKNYIDGLSEINLESSQYLLLLAGPNKSAKKAFLPRIEKKIGAMKEISLREVISQNEDESYKKIDEMFRYIGETEKNLVFRHGDALSGEYTGYTYSSVRYATPQEKYLLKKVNNSEKFIIIDLHDYDSIDKTLERYAQAIVRFDEADSLFGKLKQIRLNGHTFSNKRPVAPQK